SRLPLSPLSLHDALPISGGTVRALFLSSLICGYTFCICSTTSRDWSVESPSTTMISYAACGTSLASMLCRHGRMYRSSLRIGITIETRHFFGCIELTLLTDWLGWGYARL